VKGFLAALAVSAAMLAAVIAQAAAPPLSVEHRCAEGLRHAVIAGRHACLRAGGRCSRRHDRQYHRYGFHCHGRRLTTRLPDLSFPVRAAFYYPWFPETWTVRGQHVRYHPLLGYYDSSNAAVARSHVRQLEHGRIEAAIASWWGRGTHHETTRLPLLLNTTAALRSSLKWAVYYEREGRENPSVASLRGDLSYLMSRYSRHRSYARVRGRPVIFVYNENDSSCEVADRWRPAAAGWYVVLKVFPGYASCANQPSSWHQYAPATTPSVHLPHSYNISPGFWRADEPSPRLARDLSRWRQNVANMVASGARWQLVTSFNEWGEGTAIENAHDWPSASGFGAYLDALRSSGR
jgi:Glycosyl hydrolase family 99